jgi:hypothetical protein
MMKKILTICIAILVFCLSACQEQSGLGFLPTSTPTHTITTTFTASPTLTLTPSPTPTHIVVSRVIPKNYYSEVKIKFTMFNDGKAESICIFVNLHKIEKNISDEVVEIVPQVESQKALGTCPLTSESKNFELNVFTGEKIEAPQDTSIPKAYYGKNYQGNNEGIFTLSNPPIPAWKIIEPYNQKDILGKLDIYSGTQEKWVDKATGILIYRKTYYSSIQDPEITFLVEMISMRTNAPIGGLQEGTEFSYSKEQ